MYYSCARIAIMNECIIMPHSKQPSMVAAVYLVGSIFLRRPGFELSQWDLFIGVATQLNRLLC